MRTYVCMYVLMYDPIIVRADPNKVTIVVMYFVIRDILFLVEGWEG